MGTALLGILGVEFGALGWFYGTHLLQRHKHGFL
ncbi:hypothetical protein DFP78_1042 [Photobacterium lutimaris]|nr:hypothetical protein DFP78_1042 [Photobacterium lutimaris]